jgi:transposase
MRGDLSEADWQFLEVHLPRGGGRGRPWRDHRQVINGVRWRTRTGAPWRDIPPAYGPWKTIWNRFSRWRADGTWARLVGELQAAAAAAGMLDLDFFHLDSTIIRASRAAAGARKRGVRTTSRRTTRSAARAVASRPSSTSPASRTATN